MTTQRPACPWEHTKYQWNAWFCYWQRLFRTLGQNLFVRLGNFEIKITHTAMLFSTIELLVWMVHTLAHASRELTGFYSSPDDCVGSCWYSPSPWWPPLLLLRPWPPQMHSFPTTLILPHILCLCWVLHPHSRARQTQVPDLWASDLFLPWQTWAR